MISAESVDILVIVEVKRPTADDRPHADNEVNEYINKSQYVILTDCITWEIHEMNKETRIYYLSKERQRVCERSIPKTKKDRIINWIDNSIPNNEGTIINSCMVPYSFRVEEIDNSRFNNLYEVTHILRKSTGQKKYSVLTFGNKDTLMNLPLEIQEKIEFE